MRAVGFIPHLFKHRNGQYYFRIAIPLDLQGLLGSTGFKRSLRTSDKALALRSCRSLSNRAEQAFIEIRKVIETGGPMDLTDDRLKQAAQAHFEKCLYEGERDYWGATHYPRIEAFEQTGEEHMDFEIVRAKMSHLTSESRKMLTHLRELQQLHSYRMHHEHIAKSLAEIYHLSSGPADIADIASLVVRAQAEAERIKLAFFSGNPSDGAIADLYFKDARNFFEKPAVFLDLDDSAPVITVAEKSSETNLSTAIDLYMKYKGSDGTSDDRVREIRASLNKLAEYLGPNIDIGTLTKKAHGPAIKDFALRLPANYQPDGKRTLREIINGNDEYERIASATAVRLWGVCKAFMTWCVEDRELLLRNPLEGMKFPRAKSNRRQAFRPEQLDTIFKSPIYTGRKNDLRAVWREDDTGKVIRDGYFWVPLIGMYTGFRMGEILSLYPHDVRTHEGVLYFDVNEYEDDKSIKTDQSARGIPVHPDLLEMGFAEYCEKRKRDAQPGERLLADVINIPDHSPSKYYTKQFSDYLVNIGLKKRDGTKQDKNICFYALRHTYISSLRRIRGANEEVLNDLSGHEADSNRALSSRAGYGSLHSPSELYPYICQMKFDVDLSHLKIKPVSKPKRKRTAGGA